MFYNAVVSVYFIFLNVNFGKNINALNKINQLTVFEFLILSILIIHSQTR